MFIVLPMSNGAGFTALVGLGIGVASLIGAIISSRIAFGKEFKGN
jgi:ESS family glutamate:Na+ symporter